MRLMCSHHGRMVTASLVDGVARTARPSQPTNGVARPAKDNSAGTYDACRQVHARALHDGQLDFPSEPNPVPDGTDEELASEVAMAVESGWL